ncbi:hypothetical protein V8C40DRAFT_285814 [Trichoderma camerunense]
MKGLEEILATYRKQLDRQSILVLDEEEFDVDETAYSYPASTVFAMDSTNANITSAKYHFGSQTNMANEDLDFEIYKDRQLTSTPRRYWQQVQIHEWASGDAQFLKDLRWPLFYTDDNSTRTQRCVIARFGGFEDIKLLE